jgi:hypothetical protein
MMTPSLMLDKLAARLPRFARVEEDDEDESLVNFDLDLDKHPPAEMPPTPPDLDPLSVRAEFLDLFVY